MRILIYFTILSLICGNCLAFGGLFRRSSGHHVQQAVIVYPQTIIQEKYTIPVREIRYAEIKGLSVLQDNENNQFIVVNGKVYPRAGFPDNVINDTVKSNKENNQIIIERKITQ